MNNTDKSPANKYQNIPKEKYFKVTSKVTIYKDYVREFIPNEAYYKLRDGEKATAGERTVPKYTPRLKQNHIERSLRRTVKAIKGYVQYNDFNHFATFTFNPEKYDRLDVSNCKKVMSDWLKNIQKRKGKFEYLIVSEYHKDGALHFHALIQNYTGDVAKAINPRTGKQIAKKGRRVYNYPNFKAGHTVVKLVDNRKGTARYLTKYITKDSPIIFGKNRYWVSKGTARPPEVYNPKPWHDNLEPLWTIETVTGTITHYPVPDKEIVSE